MFKELRELETHVKDGVIVEPTRPDLDGDPYAEYIGTLDDLELQLLYSVYHGIFEDVQDHATCILPFIDEASDEDKADIAKLTIAGLEANALRELFHFALKMRFPRLREASPTDVWICTGWKIYRVKL